ncbi:hypothetical protein BDV06DRAFT_214790 [Aspergillus oleicola]
MRLVCPSRFAKPAPEVPFGRDGPVETFAPASAQNLQFAGRYLGNICTFDGTPFFSRSGREWVCSCTGQAFSPDYAAAAPSSGQSLPPPMVHGASPLPDLAFLYGEMKHYSSSTFGSFFPVIEPSLFERNSSGRACIYLLIALTALVQYFREARRHLPGLFEEPTFLNGLQALLLVCLCSQGLTGDFYTVDHLLSAASRVVFSLKAHFNYHARKLFCIVYVCDKGLGLVTDLPLRLDDAQCDLTAAMRNFTQSSTQQARRELYSVNDLRQSDAELLRTIRDLDHELEFWKESLDTIDQPSLFSIFYLQYHHCMVMIHQASSNCVSWIQDQDTQEAGSSPSISVTASSSVLHQFQSSRLDLGPENLLFPISSFIQAIIVLFYNILYNPNAIYSDHYLELISSVPILLEQHRIQEGPPCYTTKINAAAKIILELERLAKCAIEKSSMSIEELSTG